MFRYIFIALLLFSACKDKPDSQVRSTENTASEKESVSVKDTTGPGELISDTVSGADTTKLNKSVPEIFEGVYITNLNTKTLIDCRFPDSVYWVEDDTKKLEGQYSKMFSEKSVYNSVYVKVKGELQNTENTGISENYPRTIRVKEVVAMERKNPDNTCVPYDFWGIGTGNTWSLEISRFENLIELIIPEEKKTYYFFYNEPTEESGLIIYKSHNLVQRYNIEIRIRKESCTDAKSGKQYDYAVYVNINGDKVFYGCGIKGKKH